MIGDAVKKLVKGLSEKIESSGIGEPHFADHDYRPVKFHPDNFRKVNVVGNERKVAFIDGGNSELVGAPNFSVQLNRVYFNIFNGRKRITPTNLPKKIEFLSATVARFENEEVYYDTMLFPVSDDFVRFLPNPSDLSFNSLDRALMIGMARASVSRAASMARRFAEWSFARFIVEKELERGDILVMDGTLRTSVKNESDYALAAFAAAKGKGVIFSGLSKSSRLFTTTGVSLIGAVRWLAKQHNVEAPWYYHPVAISLNPPLKASIYIVMLHPMAKRAYRFEIQAEQAKKLSEKDLGEIFSQLSLNSSDPSLPGYPYGLIDADDNARVRKSELETYRVMILSEISSLGEWEKISRHMHAVDTHSILNMLKEVV